jgi:hypothetical protein
LVEAPHRIPCSLSKRETVDAATKGGGAGFVNARAAAGTRARVGTEWLRARRESGIYTDSDSFQRGLFVGEVIQGPWKAAEIPDLMRTLDDELLRMINALEKLRELHRRGEQVDLRAVLDGETK